jgi:hypothetical protein
MMNGIQILSRDPDFRDNLVDYDLDGVVVTPFSLDVSNDEISHLKYVKVFNKNLKFF